ncbi:hypothetical protein FGG08_005906 [Glutinoglossum americanum]|uniref:Ankyrin repeat protein n=1 Tax=Glutinoglossum americanum TaxID=1670608 RepID=A0A9P8HXH0_9PEZI|nr:hypothetical protein FGG08_005906 [Glutinoglossum americanum]
MAAAGGQEAIVRLLLGKGAKPTTGTDSGKTVLCMAAVDGHVALLNKDADITAEDNNRLIALHKAVVRLILEEAADVNAKDDHKPTVLHLTAGSGHDTMENIS